MKLKRVTTLFAVEVNGQLYLRKVLEGHTTWYYLNMGKENLVYDTDKAEKLEQTFNEMIEDDQSI